MKKYFTKQRLTIGELVFDSVNILLMLILTAIMIIPIIHVISVSLSSADSVLHGGLFLFPKVLI
ncbi:hypothetical protein [Treponema phagedenis]|uniref:Uncharacterized protein n=1 Tax=Treponema phagedenis TaxID=162 RepID=A0A0B7GWQ6_TREPH|nr:hypothetical protein [Treponema phagedenis]CEM62958.1 hypothetical protein TPHV1_510025 [Treponema phagedenis]